MTSSTIKTRLFFSAGHRYARPDWDEEKNRTVYGEDYSLDGMGHNFALWVTANARLGVESLKQKASKVTAELDHCLLFANHPNFTERASSLENIGEFIWQKLLTEKDIVSIELFAGKNTAFFTDGTISSFKKRYVLNCVHRHHNPNLSEDENRDLYGKCSRLHGHEYKLWVEVFAPIDVETGLIIQRHKLDRIVSKQIIEKYDKSFLNEKIGNTSGEIIIEQFFKDIRKELNSSFSLRLSLHETRKNSFFTRTPVSAGPIAT